MATVALSGTVAWTEGAVALALLAALQFAAAWVSLRVAWMRSTLTSEPTLLVRDGRVIEGALQSERITRQSLDQAVRSAGIGRKDDVVNEPCLIRAGSKSGLPHPGQDGT
ncbi:MAG: hypothetical protein M3070_12705 [Actinomycetota bacterium]|nr:hypothetical protein [Actinomycetota bacterium]